MRNFLIIISLLFLNKKINALAFNNDSLKNKYELNDPRNPNCPCHKYQKLADEEFKLRQTQQTKVRKDFVEQKTTATQTGFASATGVNYLGSTVKTKRFKNFVFSHHKNRSYKIFNFIKRHKGKKKHFIRTNKNISSCFKWR
jgi:hypothetical protein